MPDSLPQTPNGPSIQLQNMSALEATVPCSSAPQLRWLTILRPGFVRPTLMASTSYDPLLIPPPSSSLLTSTRDTFCSPSRSKILSNYWFLSFEQEDCFGRNMQFLVGHIGKTFIKVPVSDTHRRNTLQPVITGPRALRMGSIGFPSSKLTTSSLNTGSAQQLRLCGATKQGLFL